MSGGAEKERLRAPMRVRVSKHQYVRLIWELNVLYRPEWEEKVWKWFKEHDLLLEVDR